MHGSTYVFSIEVTHLAFEFIKENFRRLSEFLETLVCRSVIKHLHCMCKGLISSTVGMALVIPKHY